MWEVPVREMWKAKKLRGLQDRCCLKGKVSGNVKEGQGEMRVIYYDKKESVLAKKNRGGKAELGQLASREITNQSKVSTKAEGEKTSGSPQYHSPPAVAELGKGKEGGEQTEEAQSIYGGAMEDLPHRSRQKVSVLFRMGNESHRKSFISDVISKKNERNQEGQGGRKSRFKCLS